MLGKAFFLLVESALHLLELILELLEFVLLALQFLNVLLEILLCLLKLAEFLFERCLINLKFKLLLFYFILQLSQRNFRILFVDFDFPLTL